MSWTETVKRKNIAIIVWSAEESDTNLLPSVILNPTTKSGEESAALFKMKLNWLTKKQRFRR